MIVSKKFISVAALNDFVTEFNIKPINIETKSELYDTGLVLPGRGTFFCDRDVFKLWYENESEEAKEIVRFFNNFL